MSSKGGQADTRLTKALPGSSLPVDVRDNGQYANDDEINANQIIEYLGENHNDNAENEARYSHP
jgi:phosphosulfolactate phosphohydrolase-like enzyme